MATMTYRQFMSEKTRELKVSRPDITRQADRVKEIAVMWYHYKQAIANGTPIIAPQPIITPQPIIVSHPVDVDVHDKVDGWLDNHVIPGIVEFRHFNAYAPLPQHIDPNHKTDYEHNDRIAEAATDGWHYDFYLETHSVYEPYLVKDITVVEPRYTDVPISQRLKINVDAMTRKAFHDDVVDDDEADTFPFTIDMAYQLLGFNINVISPEPSDLPIPKWAKIDDSVPTVEHIDVPLPVPIQNSGGIEYVPEHVELDASVVPVHVDDTPPAPTAQTKTYSPTVDEMIQCCLNVRNGGFIQAYRLLVNPKVFHIARNPNYDPASEGKNRHPYMIYDTKRVYTPTPFDEIRFHSIMASYVYIRMCETWDSYKDKTPSASNMYDIDGIFDWDYETKTLFDITNIDHFLHDDA